MKKKKKDTEAKCYSAENAKNKGGKDLIGCHKH